LWIAAITGTEAKKVMIPCAAKVQVQPDVTCQGAMKTTRIDVSQGLVRKSRRTHGIDESTKVQEDRVEGDDTH
jgi:hypothetical protein